MKLNSFLYFICMIIGLILIGSCDDGSTVTLITPTNLTLNIEQIDDGSGDVNIVVTADDAVLFEFLFGDEKSGESATTSSTGIISHTYEESGTYTVQVKAIGTSTQFPTITKEIVVNVIIINELIIPTTGYTTPTDYNGMSLVWQDEFSGTVINETDWTFEIGTGSNGWGNNELEYYRRENTSIVDGNLVIEAKAESFSGRSYTSSRIITQNKQSFKYGRIDIRAVMPQGQGIWPALWMLGSNFSTVGWPSCGEIDIMEMIGGGSGRDNTVHGTCHWDNNGSYASYGGNYDLNSGILADEFHVYSIIWDQTKIVWYIDDIQYHVINITGADLSEFQEEFFLIFNVAVGGRWPGNPNSSTIFPQYMVVDYVRVFQDN